MSEKGDYGVSINTRLITRGNNIMDGEQAKGAGDSRAI